MHGNRPRHEHRHRSGFQRATREGPSAGMCTGKATGVHRASRGPLDWLVNIGNTSVGTATDTGVGTGPEGDKGATEFAGEH